MSSDSIQTTILVILMAADPLPLSVEDILKGTIGGVSDAEITEGLNDLFDKGLVKPHWEGERGVAPSAMLTESGKDHLQILVMETYAEVLRGIGTDS